MGFVEKIYRNLSEINNDELFNVYDSLYPSEKGLTGWYFDAQSPGKTLYSGSLGTRAIGDLYGKIIVIDPEEKRPPGRDIVSSLKKMNERTEKCAYIAASGSGSSESPVKNLRKIESEIEKSGLKKTKYNLITYNFNSPMGESVERLGGNLLELKGRSPESKELKNAEYIKESGYLEDFFELGLSELFTIISRGVVNSVHPEEFPYYFKNEISELQNTKGILSNLRETKEYESLSSCIKNPFMKAFSCGQAVSDNLVKSNNIRMEQFRILTLKNLDNNEIIKRLANGNEIGASRNYVIGESSTPLMDRNSFLIHVSQSGDGKEGCIKTAKDAGADIFFITKEGGAESVNKIMINSNNFYVDTCFLLADVLYHVGYQLVDEGIEIDENILGKRHAKDKIKKDFYTSS